MISFSIMNYFHNLRKILLSRNFLNYVKVIIHNIFLLAIQNFFKLLKYLIIRREIIFKDKIWGLPMSFTS